MRRPAKVIMARVATQALFNLPELPPRSHRHVEKLARRKADDLFALYRCAVKTLTIDPDVDPTDWSKRKWELSHEGHTILHSAGVGYSVVADPYPTYAVDELRHSTWFKAGPKLSAMFGRDDLWLSKFIPA